MKTVKIEYSKRLIHWNNVVRCPNYWLFVSFICFSYNERWLEKLSGIIFFYISLEFRIQISKIESNIRPYFHLLHQTRVYLHWNFWKIVFTFTGVNKSLITVNCFKDNMNRNLLNIVKSMIFWGEAVLCATYIWNRFPPSAISNKSLYEMCYNQLPIVQHFIVFCSLCYALIPKH